MSGTPTNKGDVPRQLYRMLAIVRHPSYHQAGGERRWHKARFCEGAEGRVRPGRSHARAELCSCFLQTTDRAQIFPSEAAAPAALELLAPSVAEGAPLPPPPPPPPLPLPPSPPPPPRPPPPPCRQVSHDYVLSLPSGTCCAPARRRAPPVARARVARRAGRDPREILELGRARREWSRRLRRRASCCRRRVTAPRTSGGAVQAPKAQWGERRPPGTAPARRQGSAGRQLPECAQCGVTAPGSLRCRAGARALSASGLRERLETRRLRRAAHRVRRRARCAQGVGAARAGLLLKSQDGVVEEASERATRQIQVQLRRETNTYAVLRVQPTPLVFEPRVEATARCSTASRSRRSSTAPRATPRWRATRC